jgi:Uma2 family endonuclease
MQTAPVPMMTAKEYLAFEEKAIIRHEFVAGHIFAMSGPSLRHNAIALNLATSLRASAFSTPCRVYASEIKVHVARADAYYYPDVIVTCEPQDDTGHVITNPCCLIEVLSPSTRTIDRREKLRAYQTLPSLREYVLVDQDYRSIEVYRRQGAGWIQQILDEGDVLDFECLPLSLSMHIVYEGVTVLPLPAREDAAVYG